MNWKENRLEDGGRDEIVMLVTREMKQSKSKSKRKYKNIDTKTLKYRHDQP